jgi:hypothetical protein
VKGMQRLVWKGWGLEFQAELKNVAYCHDGEESIGRLWTF